MANVRLLFDMQSESAASVLNIYLVLVHGEGLLICANLEKFRKRENVIILWKWLQTFAKATTTYRKRAVERTVELSPDKVDGEKETLPWLRIMMAEARRGP